MLSGDGIFSRACCFSGVSLRFSLSSRRAVQLGVAAKVTTLDKTHFAEVEKIGILLKNRRTSAAASAAASLAGVKGPDDLPLRPEVHPVPYSHVFVR